MGGRAPSSGTRADQRRGVLSTRGDTHAAWSACGSQAMANASARAMLRTPPPRGWLACMTRGWSARGAPGRTLLPAAACQAAGGLAASALGGRQRDSRLRPSAYRPRPGRLPTLAPTALRSSLGSGLINRLKKRSSFYDPLYLSLNIDFTIFFILIFIKNNIINFGTDY